MSIQIANRSLMCSTLVFGCFSYNPSFAYLVKNLKDQITVANNRDTKVVYYNPYSPDHRQERHVLDGYDVKKFAFAVGTVKNKSDLKYFKKLGWTVVGPDEGVHNQKNYTHVWLVHITVHDLLKELSRYDDVGHLIKDEGVKKKKAPKKTMTLKKEAA